MSATKNDHPEYLDAKAVAERLGVKLRTVYDYRSTGRLPAPDVVLGGSVGWLPETIERHIKRLKPSARVHQKRAAS